MIETTSMQTHLAQPFHGAFWYFSEHYLDRIKPFEADENFQAYPWDVQVRDDHSVRIERLSLDSTRQHAMDIGIQRDTTHGHLRVLTAQHVVTDAYDKTEISRGDLLVSAQAFQVVEFNPASVVRSLRAAARISHGM
jgi:hypothetical protein